MLRFIFRSSSLCLAFLCSEGLVIDSFVYDRPAGFEAKSFVFPSFSLSPPEMHINKINQHLTPLSSFLKEQKGEFSYIPETTQLIFNIPFSSSFYYSIPLSYVNTLELDFYFPNNANISLDFEKDFNYLLKSENCTVSTLYLPSSDLELEANHKLSFIELSYRHFHEEYFHKKHKTFISPVVSNYFPFCRLSELKLTIFSPYQERPYLRFETVQNANTDKIAPIDPNLSLIEPNTQFRDGLKISPISSSCRDLNKIYLGKIHCQISNSITFPILSTKSLTYAKLLIDPAKHGISPNKEPLISEVVSPSIIFPIISYVTIKSHLNPSSYKLTPTTYSSYILPTSLVFPKIFFPRIASLSMPNPHLSFKTLPLEKQKYFLLPKFIELTQGGIKKCEPSTLVSINEIKTQNTHPSFRLFATLIELNDHKLDVKKEAMRFYSHLTIPSPTPNLIDFKSPSHFVAKRPTVNLHKPLACKTSPLNVNSVELIIHPNHLNSIKLTNTSILLNSFNLPTTSKSDMVTALNAWNPTSLPTFLIPLPKMPSKPTYIFTKESDKSKITPKQSVVSIAISSDSFSSSHLFTLANYKPKLLPGPLLGAVGKNFLTYNLNDSPLNALVTRYYKETSSPSKTIFTYHEAISSAFQESSNIKGVSPFLASTFNFIVPNKISHKVVLPKNSLSLDALIAEALIQIDPKYAAKVGIFPQKQFLQAGDLLTLEPIQLFLPLSFLYNNTEALTIDNSISIPLAHLNSSIIQIDTLATLFLPKVNFNELIVSLETISPLSNFSCLASNASKINRQHRYSLQYLAELPSLEILQTYSLGDDFKVDAHLLQKANKDGYSISVQISPYDHECLDPIPSKVYFILDRSSSIESIRFNAFKQGLLQSLSYLHESATFNILTFDQTWEKLSPDDLKPTKASIQYMKKSLEKVSQKWSSSFPTLLSAIEELQKQAETTNEPHTVVILTNGHFLKNLRYNREAFNKLFHTATSNFSLFTAAISDNNNTFMLELMSKLGRGEFLHSQTHAAFPRKLAVLLKRLQRPLVTDLKITLIDPHKKITFAHDPLSAPLLYSDKIYNIYGEIEKLEPISLFIQGKSGDKWVNIIKKIDFTKAEKGKTIDKDLATKKALSHIMNFIISNNQNELLLAKELTFKFDIRWNL